VFEEPDSDINVPALCDLEVCAALRTLRATDALDLYLALPLRRHDHEPLARRVLELSEAMSVYEAVYVALAERLDAILITGDAGLTIAARTLDLNVIGVAGA
jgi:predicted nucleic acid-binding protein